MCPDDSKVGRRPRHSNPGNGGHAPPPGSITGAPPRRQVHHLQCGGLGGNTGCYQQRRGDAFREGNTERAT